MSCSERACANTALNSRSAMANILSNPNATFLPHELLGVASICPSLPHRSRAQGGSSFTRPSGGVCSLHLVRQTRTHRNSLGKPRDRSSLKRGFFFDPPLGTRDFCRGEHIKPV